MGNAYQHPQQSELSSNDGKKPNFSKCPYGWFAALLVAVLAVATTIGLRTQELEIISRLDPLNIHSESPPPAWHPTESKERLGLRLPYDWPAEYREKYAQPFNPFTFFKNARAICGWIRANGSNEIAERLADELYKRMLDYTLDHSGVLFVRYNFDYDFEGNLLPAGWVSAFGNGLAISGLIAFYDCFPKIVYLDTARDLYRAFLIRGNIWIAEDLQDGTVWFEEYPLREGPQPRVLNGHILAVIGLYYLYELTRDRDVLKLLKQGINAVKRHGWRYRRHGRTNLYDLRPPDTDDYGPARAIHQQDILCLMTRDPVFREYRDAFAKDMPIAAKTVIIRC